MLSSESQSSLKAKMLALISVLASKLALALVYIFGLGLASAVLLWPCWLYGAYDVTVTFIVLPLTPLLASALNKWPRPRFWPHATCISRWLTFNYILFASIHFMGEFYFSNRGSIIYSDEIQLGFLAFFSGQWQTKIQFQTHCACMNCAVKPTLQRSIHFVAWSVLLTTCYRIVMQFFRPKLVSRWHGHDDIISK